MRKREKIWSVGCWILALALAGGVSPARAAAPGIYLEDAAAKTEKAIAASLTLDFQGKNIGASMLTLGLIKPKTLFSFEGTRSDLRLGAQPAFRFRFAPKRDAQAMQDPAQAMEMLSGKGMPMGAAKPEDFVLVSLTVQGEERQLVLVQKRGAMKPKNATFGLSVEKLGDGDFRVRPKAPLPPGEYGFFCGSAGAMPEIWAFGVD